MALIYESMLADSKFDPIVATIPRRLTGDDGYGGEKKAHKFLKKLGVAHVRLIDPNPWQSLEHLKQLTPDYVFLNYPWQRNYQPPFRPDSLVQFTKILYTPYFLAPLVSDRLDETVDDTTEASNEAEAKVATHLFTQRAHQLASLIFVQDQATKDAFNLTERGSTRVHFTGSPKLDSLRQNYRTVSNRLTNNLEDASAAKPDGPKRKYDLKVLWAPHHSYSPAWLNFGMFATSYQFMLQLAEKYPNVLFVLRPHPFLFGTLVDRGVLTGPELSQWRQEWKTRRNTKTNSKANFVKQFAVTDLLITDGISFLAEYPLITGRAGIFLENAHHWPFNNLGLLAADANFRITRIEELERYIEAALEGSNTDYKLERSAQLARMRETIDPNPGHSSSLIVAAINQDFAQSTALVDPSKISEIAWEDQPGREPRRD